MLVALLVVSLATQSFALDLGDPGGPPPVSTKGTTLFGDLDKQFVLYLLDRPFFINEKDIDRIVGDPRTLEPSTAAKLRLFPARLRLKLYSILNAAPGALSMTGGTIDGHNATLMQMDEATTMQVLDGIQNTLTDHFREEELVDLGVYVLSFLPFFPKTDQGWHDLKQGIIMSDLLLALAYVLTTAELDTGVVKTSGWLVKLPGDKFRIGWYTTARHLGFKWHPDLSAGIKGTGALIDVQAGIVHHVNAGPKDEKTALEFDIREAWLKRFSKPYGWEISLHGSARYITEHGDPRENGALVANADVFGKKTNIFGKRDINLIMSAKGGSDFRHWSNAEGSVGIENGAVGLAGGINVFASRDDLNGNSMRAGLFLDGTLDGDSREEEHRVARAGYGLREKLEYIERLDHEFEQAEQRLSLYTRAPRTPEVVQADREILEELHQRDIWITRGIPELRDYITYYTALWRRHCASLGLAPQKCREQDGPLDVEILNRGRLRVKTAIPTLP